MATNDSDEWKRLQGAGRAYKIILECAERLEKAAFERKEVLDA